MWRRRRLERRSQRRHRGVGAAQHRLAMAEEHRFEAEGGQLADRLVGARHVRGEVGVGPHHSPIGARPRLKLGLEFSDVEVLECSPTPEGNTAIRLTFITPSPRFVHVVEQWIPVATNERETFGANWTGLADHEPI